MILSIIHSTEYAYSTPAGASIQYLRLSPRPEPSQRLLRWRLKAPGSIHPWWDGFGNLVHTVAVTEPHHRVEIAVEGEVDTRDTNGVLPLDPAGPPPEAYLRPTELTLADDGVRDFARPHAPAPGRNRLAALHGLMAAIHQRVGIAECEDDQGAAVALERGTGTCRDHAHLFIACCRSLGVPARYVSGYLHTAAEAGRHLATHAWAEAEVEYLGWVSFDPCNCQSATHAYVRLAVALDGRGAAPVRGVQRGGSGERMRTKVRLEAMREEQ